MKAYFTVIFSQEVPVEIDYVEGDTNDEITDRCIQEAKKNLKLDFKVEIGVKLTDYIKMKL